MAATAKRGANPLVWLVGLVLFLSVAVAVAWAGTAPLQGGRALRTETTAGGVRIETIVEGQGPFALPDDTVAVIYTGKLMDGTVFDSNAGKDPLVFRLDQVIRGWQQGLQKMRAGGRARLTIPSALGYGASGSGPIPPNSDLVFDVQLLAIKPR